MKLNAVAILGLVTLSVALMPLRSARGGVFGEVAGSIGGTFPQGTFTHYADPGWVLDGRATIHIPQAELFAGWVGLSYALFKYETAKTVIRIRDTDSGFETSLPVERKTREQMFALHGGLQLGSTTRRAFIRPRAAIGLGLYYFHSFVKWDRHGADGDTTIAEVSLDSHVKGGWRARVGFDLFFTPQMGGSADFVYDHVFNLNQSEGPNNAADLTAIFQGFTVGVVYMFDAGK